MNFDNSFIEKIKDENDIVDVVSEYVSLKGTHGNWMGLCPFHNEKTPSFSVNQNGQFYKCFGCQKSGDVISFIQEKERLEFVDAVIFLANRAMIPLPEKKEYSVEEKKVQEEKDILMRINLEAARFFRECLWKNLFALEYLEKRDLNREIILHFGLGYAPFNNDLYEKLEKFYTEDDLLKSGIFLKRDNGEITCRFKNRVMFPIFNPKGKVIAFGGRALNDSYPPKYLNSPETIIFFKKNNLYSLNFARKSIYQKDVILVEGYMDTITLHRYGFSNTVASLGTAFTEQQAELLKKNKVKNVYLCYDSDNAGRLAAKRAMDILYKQELEGKVVILDAEKDPDDYLKKYGPQKFEQCLTNALNIIDFELYLLSNDVDLEKENDKLLFVKNAVSVLKKYEGKIPNSFVLIEQALKKISFSTGISIKSLGQEMYGKYFSPNQFHNHSIEKEHVEKIEIDFHDYDKEKMLIDSIYHYGIDEYITKFSIKESDFFSEENRSLFRQLLAQKKDCFEDSFSHDGICKIEDMPTLIYSIRQDNIRRSIDILKKRQRELMQSGQCKDELIRIGIDIISLQKELKNIK